MFVATHFYQCESHKLEAGRTDTFMAYLKSDVVYYLDLYPFIEDLSLTVKLSICCVLLILF